MQARSGGQPLQTERTSAHPFNAELAVARAGQCVSHRGRIRHVVLNQKDALWHILWSRKSMIGYSGMGPSDQSVRYRTKRPIIDGNKLPVTTTGWNCSHD